VILNVLFKIFFFFLLMLAMSKWHRPSRSIFSGSSNNKLALLRHVVSDKYVDVDFENVHVELLKKVVSKNVRHVNLSIAKMSKKV